MANYQESASFTVRVLLADDLDLKLIWQDYSSKWEPIMEAFLSDKIRSWSRQMTFQEGQPVYLPGPSGTWAYNRSFENDLMIIPSNENLVANEEFRIDDQSTVNILQLDIEFTSTEPISHSCIFLAWLLQNERIIDGVPEHLFALRRCIIDEVIQYVETKAWVTFDSRQIRQIMEEWLIVELKDSLDDQNRHQSEDYAFTRVKLPWGRSSGIVAAGPRGVGKSAFCKCFIDGLVHVAPWLVNVVYCPSDDDETGKLRRRSTLGSQRLRDGDETDQEAPVRFFDGGQFILYGKSSTESSMTVPRFFSYLRSASALGKIVVTLLDSIDLLSTGKDSDQYLRQIYYHLGKIDYEYFVLTTSSSSVMVKDNMMLSPYPSLLIQFPLVKVYDLSLSRAYDFIKENVAQVSGLAFQPQVVEKVRASALLEDDLPLEEKRALIRRLHNMSVQDLRRVSLNVSIMMAQEILSLGPQTEHVSFSEALRKALCTRTVYEGLAPAVTGSLEWVFDDLFYSPQVDQAAEAIYNSIVKDKKYIHFVHLEADMNLEDIYLQKRLIDKYHTAFKDRLKIPMGSAYSLLHHLHMKLNFRSSFQLTAPSQLLPHTSFHSAIVPYSSINPFNDFYWFQQKSAIIVNDLETVCGYHEEFVFDNVEIDGSSFGTGKGVSESRTVGQSIGVGLDMTWKVGRGVVAGQLLTDAMMLGSNTGSNLDFNVGMQSFGAGGGIENSWNTEISKGHQLINSLADRRGISPAVDAGYGMHAGRSHKAHSDVSFSNSTIKGEQAKMSIILKHPEALTKLIMGLQHVKSASVRDVDQVSNVVIIFYKRLGCFEEVVLKKLGWGVQADYCPPAVGCEHFKTRVEMKFSCCNKWYSCKQCHNDQESHENTTLHKARCLYCFNEFQPTPESGKCCESCGQDMAEYYCYQCALWHPRPDLQHCTGCNSCFNEEYFAYHQQVCNNR